MKNLSLLVLPLFLGACAMHSPSFIEDAPMQVQPEKMSSEFMADKVSKSQLNGLANDIIRRAEGPVTVTVHYVSTPLLKSATQIAQAQGGRVKAYLHSRGVTQTIQTQLQVNRIAGPNTIIISYDALKAHAAPGCTDITSGDADNYSHGTDSAYRFGCAHQQQLSEMIARPADLLGNDATAQSDSTHLTKTQDAYRAGERATDKSDEGLSASTVYNN